MGKFDIFLSILVVAYISVLGWYIKNTIAVKKKTKKKRKNSRSKSSSSRKRTAGKTCPECKRTIDKRRTVCQHCGHKFETRPGAEPHPEEVKAGIVQPSNDEEKSA